VCAIIIDLVVLLFGTTPSSTATAVVTLAAGAEASPLLPFGGSSS
jgi:hypothetical protein